MNDTCQLYLKICVGSFIISSIGKFCFIIRNNLFKFILKIYWNELMIQIRYLKYLFINQELNIQNS